MPNPVTFTRALADDTRWRIVRLEIEYEDRVISQYTINALEISPDAVILELAHKHTECLAPELCGLPSLTRLPAIGGKNPCCGPAGCC